MMMTEMQITFLDEHEAHSHEQALAKILAEALLYKVRLQRETDNVKREKRVNVSSQFI